MTRPGDPPSAHEGGEGDPRGGVEEAGEGGGAHGQARRCFPDRQLAVEVVLDVGEHLVDPAGGGVIEAGDVALGDDLRPLPLRGGQEDVGYETADEIALTMLVIAPTKF